MALSGGQATITTTLTSYGGNQSDYTIRAIYSGDGSFQASQSPDFTQDITRPPTTTALTSSLNPSVLSQAVTFTATVTSPGTAPVSGSVRFYNGGAQIGGAVGVNASGQAALTTSALPAGAHFITAQFGSSGGEHASSTSAPLTQFVDLGLQPTTTVLASAPNPSVFGQSVTFTATVAGAGGTPTGTVIFRQGSTTLDTATLSGGTATFATSSLAAGSHSIVAVYGGDTSFSGNLGSTTHTVNQASQTINFTNPGSQVFGAAPFGLTATASSGLTPVVFASTTTVGLYGVRLNGDYCRRRLLFDHGRPGG